MKIIKILLFDDIELLDFAGPLQVFSAAAYLDNTLGLQVSTVAFKGEIIVHKSGLEVTPGEIDTNEKMDLLVLPGGIGTRRIIKDDPELGKIDGLIKNAAVTASVCSGALILAKLGYLKGLTAITHRAAIEELRQIDGSITIDETRRYVDNEHMLTAAGISAGIDMSLYLLEKYYGRELREKTQRYMEYAV